MSTIYSRSYALFKEKKIPYMPEHGQMMQIGIAVIKKFKEQNRGMPPKKIQAPEYVGTFKVAYYPASFTAVIDEFIQQFVSGKKFKNPLKMKQHG